MAAVVLRIPGKDYLIPNHSGPLLTETAESKSAGKGTAVYKFPHCTGFRASSDLKVGDQH